MWNLINSTNELIYKTEIRLTDIGKKLNQRGKGQRKDKLGACD